jgi:hypothetical protein
MGEGRDLVKLRLPKYVNAFNAKGRRYYYFRRPGAETIRLPMLGTPEFEAAYQAALHGEEIGSSRTIPGTVNAAVVGHKLHLGLCARSESAKPVVRSIAVGSNNMPCAASGGRCRARHLGEQRY